MEPFKERMITELGDLQFKLSKLEDFIGGEKFQELDAENRELLLTQKDAMSIYYRTLHKRVQILCKE